MANYTLVPVDGNQIRDHFGDAIFDKLVPYQPHLFDNVMWSNDENGNLVYLLVVTCSYLMVACTM